MQVGLAGGGTVNTTGGVRVTGNGRRLGLRGRRHGAAPLRGVIAPVLRNEGGITGAMLSDAAGSTARAILIEPGATVSALQNANTISAQVAGQQGNAAAIVDRSGSLTEIENIGTIGAARTLTDVTQAVSGHDIALDLSANTTGVHIIQSEPTGATVTPAITGSVLLAPAPTASRSWRAR